MLGRAWTWFASLSAVLVLTIPVPARAQETSAGATAQQAPPGVKPCADLPQGELSTEELARLVPEGSPGKVRIRWKTESQEECYGFNIYRADQEGGTFRRINTAIIPGEGSTNIPKEYCVEDNSVERGKTYFYYIEEVSNQGVATKLEDTLGPDGKGTRAKVKTVEEEREWLRKKALGLDTAPTTAPASPKAAKPAAQPVQIQAMPAGIPPPAAPAAKNPLE